MSGAARKAPAACPICRAPLGAEPPATRPFCSDRCRSIDLGNWLGETYRIPIDESSDAPPDDDAL